jgi:hypothetical protein
MNTGRLDGIIRDLVRLQQDAQGILDAYVNEKICNAPGVSFGEAKAHYISAPAGLSLNYVAALKHVRERLTAK